MYACKNIMHTCIVNYVYTQENYLYMRDDYVYMQIVYVYMYT